MLAAMILAYLIIKAWGQARTEQELAAKGIVPPRMQAKYGPDAAAKVAKYGMLDYFRDVYRDFWGRRGEAIAAARDATPAPGQTKVRLRDKLAAAGTALTTSMKKLVQPSGQPKPAPAGQATPRKTQLAVDTGDVPEGTARFTDQGREEFHNGRWERVPDQPAPPTPPTRPAADNTTSTPPATPGAATPTGGTVTAPTGEAVNYQTTVAELDAMNRQLAHMVETVQVAKDATERAAASLDAVESQRRPLATATITAKEHLEGMSLDATTMNGVDSACEALAPNPVAALLATFESAQEQLQKILAAIEAAQAGVQASRQNVIGTYGGAADVVEQTGVNARFLDSGATRTPGGASASPASASPQGSPPNQESASPSNIHDERADGAPTYTARPAANVGAFAGRGETVNVDGDAVGSRGTGSGSPWAGRPAGTSVDVVTASGGTVNVGHPGYTANLFPDMADRGGSQN